MFKELNIMEPFFEAPKREFSVREAAKLLKVAPATASKALAELASLGLLTVREDRLANLYAANIGSDGYKDLKRYFTIRKLKESGFLEAINKRFASPTILLCGQAAEGNDTEADSIDLIVISGKKEVIPDKALFEQKLKRQLRIFAAANFNEIESSFLKGVGSWIVLQGNLSIYNLLLNKGEISEKPSKPESLHRRYIQ
jgi:hypothetical protein